MFGPHVVAIALLAMAGVSLGYPHALPYPLLYFRPHYLEQGAPLGVPLVNNRVWVNPEPHYQPEVSSEEEEEEEEEGGFEVSQFHTQDQAGRVVFGFHSPEHVRMEARNSDGTVRGSYSYVDPYGNIVKMQYWDDGTGFHAAGDHLPVAVYEAPQYTPEVKAAREEHFRLFEQAAAAAIEAGDGESNEGGPNGGLQGEEYDSPSDDTVRVESDYPPLKEMSTPLGGEGQLKFPFNPDPSLFPDQYLDSDKESVSIDNPNYRRAKSQGLMSDIAVKGPQERIERGRNTPGFYYHFSHPIPRADLLDAQQVPSVSRIAANAGAIPPDAVHDAQVSPSQRVNLPDHQVLPVLEDSLPIT